MKKVIITGASGFIGTNLFQYLTQKKYEVINIDYKDPKCKNVLGSWKKVDIKDYDELKKEILSFNPDYIIHLAARTDLDGKTMEDYSANIVGVKNLMEVVKLLPNLKKVVIASSMLVCHAGYYPKNQFDYSPTTLYGRSKVETEKIIWENKPHCDWAIIRPTSIWGPWFGIPYRNFFDIVLSHKYFHIGKKGCTKTYGYVGNAVYQIEHILLNETLDENQKIFYIGDNPPINIEDWANQIANEKGFKIIRMPYCLVKIAACLGDFLKIFGVTFPMTSFRLKNMTTDNIMDLSATYKIANNPPFTRLQGIKETLKWLED